MTVKFKNGGTYTYEDVEPHLHDNLMAAESPGKFFFGFVKNRHKATKTA